jgi:hypothetical protein
MSFFNRALAPELDDRHPSAADMLWAWREAFRAGRRPSTRTDHPTEDDEPAPFEVPPSTTAATPLAGLPLSARAVAALERLEILTVGDLLGEPLNRLRQLRGTGAAIRNELVAAVAHLRESLAVESDFDDDAPLDLAARALILDPPDIVPVFSQAGYPQDIVPQEEVIGPQEIVPAVVLSAVSAAAGMGRRG